MKRGSIIIEALLALAIGTAMLTVVSQALNSAQRGNLQSSQYQQAELYLQEGQEIIKSIQATNWAVLADNGTFHPVVNSGNWILQQEAEALGIYNRSITIDFVYRDTNGDIVSEGGILDPASKKVTVVVTWEKPRHSSISRTFYITRFRQNDSWLEDSGTDFGDGTENATDVTTSPGDILIAHTGGGGWTQPKSLGTVDGQRKASGICNNGRYLYLTQDHTVAGIEVFDTQANPAVPQSKGTFSVTYRPNDCSTASNYLYLCDNFFIFPSISIWNIGSNPLNPPYVSNIFTIFSTKSVASNSFYLFTSINNSNIIRAYSLDNNHYTNPQLLDYFSTTANIASLALSGNYLYVAQESTAQAIRIYNIAANPANPQYVGTIPLLYQPTGVAVDGNILYVTMSNKTGAMLSINNPSSPQLYGYFPTVRNTADVTAIGDYGYVAGSDSQLKVIEVFDLSDSKGITGVYFIYGEYTSSTFDAGQEVVFNRLTWQGTKPAGSNILFQVAINTDGTTWNYVGPDGTSSTYYESAGAIPLTDSLGQYLRYKVILTGDGDTTPIVSNVSINYSL